MPILFPGMARIPSISAGGLIATCPPPLSGVKAVLIAGVGGNRYFHGTFLPWIEEQTDE